MPEIRLNRVTGDWVIIATERAKRPEQFRHGRERKPLPAFVPDCPFCPGNEAQTPPEQFRLPAGGGAWAVRTVPNKYSALRVAGAPARHGLGLQKFIEGVGRHEVIVETPAHNQTLALLPPARVADVLRAYRDRFCAFYADPRVEHVVVFKNHGPTAGTSLEHPHSQIVGTPVVPGQVRVRIEEALRRYDDFGECLYCWTLREELADGARVVLETPSFAAFIPYAALSPYHLWIFPKRHHACFGDATEAELEDLAALLREILRRIALHLDDPDFNFVIQSLSPTQGALKYFHWYFSIVPRLTTAAGFELGTGMFINVALPEESARFLREQPA
jgi:UDPglucose--hexose-1-phosphate uridylyltransferase